MADDQDSEGFTFGDFKFAPQPSQPHNDLSWGDFFSFPTTPKSNPQNSMHSDPSRPDSGPNRGALSLPLFGEVEEETSSIGDNDNRKDDNLKGWFDGTLISQNGKFGVSSVSSGGLDKQIKPANGLVLDFNVGDGKAGNLNGLFDQNKEIKDRIGLVSNLNVCDDKSDKLNGWFDPKTTVQDGKVGGFSVSNGGFDMFGKLDVQNHNIEGRDGSVSDSNVHVDKDFNLNGWFDRKPTGQEGKVGVHSVSNGNGDGDVFGKLYQDQQIKSQSGLVSNSNVVDGGKISNLSGWFDPNAIAQDGKFGVPSVANGAGFSNGYGDGDVFGNFYSHDKKINTRKGLGSDLNFDGDNDDDEDGEWEFKGASDWSSKENGDSVLSGPREKPEVVVGREQQAGQGACASAEVHPGSSGSSPQFVDLFAAHNGAVHKSDGIGVGFNFNSTTVITSDYMQGSFPGVGDIGNVSGTNATAVDEDDDFDDFGDFVDASQEVASSKQEQVSPHMTPAEEKMPKEELQTQQENSRGALPLSLFSDGTEEPSDCSNFQDEIVDKPAPHPRNGFSSQGAKISIHDLISNLYSQAPPAVPVDDSNGKSDQNGGDSPKRNMDSTPLNLDDEWDDNFWEFKDAFSDSGLKEQSFSSPRNGTQKLPETSSVLQLYIDFYAKLRDELYILLSHQLDEEMKARTSDPVNGNIAKAEAADDDIQEAYKLLEESKVSQEISSKKPLDRSSCLNEVVEALEGPKFKVIDSEYSLSKRLLMAPKQWRVAAELLRHAVSTLHIFSLGSAHEQSVYVSTWSKIINVCAQELKYGALIWNKSVEKKLQLQILSDPRGQRYIQALGEIYKVVELLELSAKLYKPWILLSVSDPLQLYNGLYECSALWASSGLEEALQNMSDNVDFGSNDTAKALVASIKNICDLDVFSMHDRVSQQISICRMSLLPQELLPDLKTVLWNEELYFVNLANLWANLISCNPPQLPHLQAS